MIRIPESDIWEPGLSGHILTFARIVWFVMMAMGLFIMAIAIPGYVSIAVTPVDTELVSHIPPAAAAVLQAVIAAESLLGSLAGFVMAVLLFRRAHASRIAYFISLFLIAYNTVITGPLESAGRILYSGDAVYPNYVFDFLILSAAWLFWLFPSGRFVPRWTRYLVVPALMIVVLAALTNTSAFTESGTPTISGGYYRIFFTIMWFSALVAQIYRYWRVSNHVERQQAKWVLVGLALWIGIIILDGTVIVLWDSSVASLLWFLGLLMLPLSLTLAILRYRLWDIDFVIRRTLTYGIITTLLAGVYFGAVTLLQSAFVSITGQQSPLAVVVSTLAIAALFNPLRVRLQNFLDRRFNRRRYNAEKTLEAFAEAMRDDVDMDHLSAALVGVVEDTMQPESVGLWLRESAAQRGASQESS